MSSNFRILLLGLSVLTTISGTGCSRSKHLRRADQAARCVLQQKTAGANFQPPAGYSVMPDPRARFYDPTCVVDPRLPSPAPKLYGYALPELQTLPPDNPHANSGDHTQTSAVSGTAEAGAEDGAEGSSASKRGADNDSDAGDSIGETIDEDGGASQAFFQQSVRPLEATAWEPLPASCLRRMLEFDSVRSEYSASFPGRSAAPPSEAGRQLPLAAIVELALINSREYQTQKEQLYQTALRLTLERYAYELQFFQRGNGTSINYGHVRNQGSTVNSLAIPTAVGVQKVTRRGADVLAQFANDIVLTFNGPTGFSSRIGSELLFQISQSVIQRDVIFESLTQAERDVVYAARDFARFRKEFFVNFARDYYSLLLSYRLIEINSFDYFSNQREFRKGEATFRAGKVSRIQVDQFEQNALRSRSNLVRSCNSLEQSLDNLKLRIGVPPEMPLNVDLSELEDLTLRDSLAATFEQARRNRHNLEREWNSAEQELAVQLNLAKLYTETLSQILQLQTSRTPPGASPDAPNGSNEAGPRDTSAQAEPGGQSTSGDISLNDLLQSFNTIEALLRVSYSDDVLQEDLKIDPPVAPLRIFQRRMELGRALLEAKRLLDDSPDANVKGVESELEALLARLNKAITDRNVDEIDASVKASAPALQRVLDFTKIDPKELDAAALRDEMKPLIERLLAVGVRMDGAREELPNVDIDMDHAMLTAATQRLELANQREQLADAWRQIKLRGDDLKAIVNWSFRQSIRTPSSHNRPFSFTFDESDSRLRLSFDAPLNRFRERNNFRFALINYNRQLRSLIQQEDQIKLAIRNDLRDLQLDRNQYEIAVASAALAAERVNSTRLRFDQGNGTARDFLEAQQAYTESLNAVAREHIGYLVDRMQLFLDLEQLQVDELGYWQDLYVDSAQPQVRLEMPQHGASIYGDLPCVKYSACMKRMLAVPAGNPRIELPADEGQREPHKSHMEAVEPQRAEPSPKLTPKPALDDAPPLPKPVNILPAPRR